MADYKWKDGSAKFQKHDPQAIGEALERLRERHGSLKEEDIVDAARARTSPLHPLFPWNDAEAAALARKLVAAQLIRAITIRIERVSGAPIDTRAFVSTKTKDKERHYTSMSVAMEDAEGRAYLIREAWLNLKAWRRRYGELTELAEIFDAIDAALERKQA